jgi:aerobic C4-dicarboxylate transport protein
VTTIIEGRRPLYRQLWVHVLIAMLVGVVLGYVKPDVAKSMKPLGDGFIKLIRMVIAPIIFVTVVSGIYKMQSMKEVGRIGIRALIYFEVVSTLALIIGLVVALVLRPGAGINADASQLDPKAMAPYLGGAAKQTATEFLLNIIPSTLVGAFSEGQILQVMLISILVGLALLKAGERVRSVMQLLDQVSAALFALLGLIMSLAAVGTFGAMAFTVGAYGLRALLPLAKFVVAVYATCIFFILVVLGVVARMAGFRILKFIAYIKEEILLVLATSTSEVALPRLITKLEQLGCRQSVVGLVVPTGYSFNTDGSAIYQSMGVLFIAQAMNIHLTRPEMLTIFAVMLLMSKGVAGVSGSTFVTLAATLATVQTVPVAGMALLLGIERFMSMARATTNMIGNGVAGIAVARWDGALDVARIHDELDRRVAPGERVPVDVPERSKRRDRVD